jgi:prepilin-type N-terminal cleavage/methylation domain-containing protein
MNASVRLNPPHEHTIKGMTLVEVMVSATIFAFAATALVGLFIQNQRFSTYLSYRAQAVTASLSILEQLRFRQYAELEDIYNDGTSGSISIDVVDPSITGGYNTLTIPINVRDGVKVTEVWQGAQIVVDPDNSAPKLPMKFFFMLTKVKPTSGTKVDLFEVVLLYRWLGKGKSTADWQTGNVRLIVPNLNPIS